MARYSTAAFLAVATVVMLAGTGAVAADQKLEKSKSFLDFTLPNDCSTCSVIKPIPGIDFRSICITTAGTCAVLGDAPIAPGIACHCGANPGTTQGSR